MGRFLRIFTEIEQEEIEKLESLPGAAINEAKARLADEATTLLHGPECLPEIRAAAAALFSGSKGGAPLDTSALPRVTVTADEVGGDGVPLVDLFVKLEFGKSKGEVKRQISGGGIRVQDEKVQDPAMVISTASFADAKEIKLSWGKKKHGIVELV